MASPGRKRSSTNLPAHIEADKLPKGVWYSPKGTGRWIADSKDAVTGKKVTRRLCDGKASLSQIWQAYEASLGCMTKTIEITGCTNDEIEEIERLESQVTTFKTLSNAFQKSPKWRELSLLTQKDYLNCHKQICNTKTGKGLFGDIAISAWKKSTILKYRDFRAEDSKSRANKELAYIKRVFSWAFEYEKITDNISRGISKIKQAPRQHYATERDFNFLLQVAKDSNYHYMAPLLELCYQCRMRLSEALDLTDANELPEGLMINRRKGSRDNVILWSASFKKTWDALKTSRNDILKRKRIPQQISPKRRYVFISSRTGDRLTVSAIGTAKKRLDVIAKAKAERLNVPYIHFTIHDTKRRGTTDTPGSLMDKMDATGHRSLSMMKIYDLEIKRVKPAKED